MAKILICDPIRETALKILGKENEVVNSPRISRQELLDTIGEFEAMVIRSRTKVDSEVLARASKLRVIARAGVGTDNIDIETATEKGILVVNSPDPSTTSVAEHVFALLLCASRKIARANESLTKGEWKKSNLVGREIEGKNIGIIGLGRIGTKVATIAKGFGLNILVSDPYASEEYVNKMGAELVQLEDLLAKSDFVTLHVPLTESTRGLIGEEELQRMKRNAILVNTSRAQVVDADSLIGALRDRKIACAALDVFDRSRINELSRIENLILTPHLGASTHEAQSQIARVIADEVLEALKGKPTRNPVNMPYIDRKSLRGLQPYLELTGKMVEILTLFVDSRPELASLSLLGEATEVEDADYLMRRFMLGILSQFHEVNIVNVMTAVERMGIETEISRSSARDVYLSSLQLKVRTSENEWTVKGALLDSNKPRIVGLADYDLEFAPEGHILITEHRDIPGMVGAVGTRLGSSGINIATMQVSRKKMGDLAVMVIQTDREVPADLIKELRSMKGMERVETLSL